MWDNPSRNARVAMSNVHVGTGPSPTAVLPASVGQVPSPWLRAAQTRPHTVLASYRLFATSISPFRSAPSAYPVPFAPAEIREDPDLQSSLQSHRCVPPAPASLASTTTVPGSGSRSTPASPASAADRDIRGRAILTKLHTVPRATIPYRWPSARRLRSPVNGRGSSAGL